MTKRVALILTVAVLGVAGVSTAALAGAQVGSSAPNAQVGEYVEQVPPSVAAGGQLPFTGLMLLPLLMVGVLLVLGAYALRRRASDPHSQA
jgi:hypothetical protein